MNKIPEEVVERIIDRADIVDVISEFVTLKKRGVNHVGVCPFHQDNSPSMYVSPVKNIFKCFACGTGGDVVGFVMKHEKISYPESLRYLARKYNVEIPQVEMSHEDIERENRRESLFIILNKAQEKYTENLSKNEVAINYLKGRKISAETLKIYGAGCAESTNQFVQLFPRLGFDIDLVKQAGIIRNDDGVLHDHLRARITFPFFDLQGRVIGFTGRATAPENKVKYQNTSETELYTKGRTLFGLYQARQEISRRDKVHIVEGQFDVLSLSDKGIQNVIAGSGTAFTDDQVKLIARFTQNVSLIYDGDDAGRKAALSNIRKLLEHGMKVRVVNLPEGEDPDSLAQKHTETSLSQFITSNEKPFINYLFNTNKDKFSDPYKQEETLELIADCISVIPDLSLRNQMISVAASLFKKSAAEVKSKLKPSVERPSQMESGFYGIDEAVSLFPSDDRSEVNCSLTFDFDSMIDQMGEVPVIYIHNTPSKTQLQQLRAKVINFRIDDLSNLEVRKIESQPILTLKEMIREGFSITTIDEEGSESSFIDYYIGSHRGFKNNGNFRGADIPVIIDRCAEMISLAEPTRRTANMKFYADCLEIKEAALKEILKPILAKRKDKSILETQLLDSKADLFDFDPDRVPEYVDQDPLMRETYNLSGFYPLLNLDKIPVAYMFKNQQGGGHSMVSDFFMEPLLHVHSPESQSNKRVIQLNHRFLKKTHYVEWQSSVFANLGKVNERLIEEGAYNFDGNLTQFKKIWKAMSYKFTRCVELRVFGQQPEEFFAFSNAILHEVDGIFKVERMNDLGVVSHNGENYYAPAFSKIYSNNRMENDPFEQDRHLIYKEISENDSISFSQWASLMDEVYKVNDNGKWAVLFSFICAFRDYIYMHRKYFTSLFFIGPTGSGKSQVAESIRNMFMDSNTPAFNLNTGTDAAFFMILERLRNIPVVLEEYNDNTISPVKFQGLKSATLDGEGKIKVKDVASKTMDSSKINAIPLPLGQEAAQQDDGALSNRCIICEVPYKPKGEFTDEETAIFELLKKHERIGLCNVLVEILSLRPKVKKHFLDILPEETKKLKEAVKINMVNTEGLTRIINAVALLTTSCRFLIEHAPGMSLPFTYEEFFVIACNKVLKQMETISSSNKLSTYFNTISFLVNQGRIKIDRELKVAQPGKITRMLSGKETEEVILTPSETKVLYIDFKGTYSLYQKTVGDKDALSSASLRVNFESNAAYLGLCKSTQFKWQEVVQRPDGRTFEGESRNDLVNKVEYKKNNTSAYMFNYDKLKELMDIDFEREIKESKEDSPDIPDPLPEPGLFCPY
ncbi:hypothetical protein MASR1M31_03310 [Porphyromonadaceae bacterium]